MERIFRVNFYPQDWLIDTSRLTPEQRGIYIQLVALIYANRGPIEANAQWIAGHCNCSSRLITATIQALLKMDFIQLSGEKITQKRAERELNSKRTHFESSANGGRTKAEREREIKNNSNLTSSEQAELLPTSKAIAIAEAIAKDNPPAPKGEQPVIFPFAGPRQPAGWGTWCENELKAPRDAIAEQWALFSEYYGTGKGRAKKSTPSNWFVRWKSWCRKEFGTRFLGAGFANQKQASPTALEGITVY